MAGPTGLQKMVIELPLTGKLDQKQAEEIRPMLDLYVLSNVDLSEPGKIKRREGHEDMSISMFDGYSFGLNEKLAARGEELIVIQNQQVTLGSGGGAGNAGDSITSYSPAAQRWKRHAKIARPTMRRILTNREGNSNTVAVAVNSAGYMILVWAAVDWRFIGSGNGQAVVAQVYDVSVTPPVLVEDTHILDETDTTAPITVKAIALPNGELTVVWNYSGVATASSIVVSGWSPSSRAWVPPVNITVTGTSGAFDICTYTTDSFVVAYDYDLSTVLAVRQIQFNIAGYSSVAIRLSAVPLNLTSFAIDVKNSIITVLASDGTSVYVFIAPTMSAYTVDGTAVQHASGAGRYARVGIVGTSSTEAWAFYWDRGVVGTPPTADILYWRKLTSGLTGSGSVHKLVGVVMSHAPFEISGRVYVPVAACDPEENTGIYWTRPGNALFEIDTANSTNAYATGIPAGAWATDIGNHKVGFGVSGEYASTLRGCVVGSQYFCADVVVGELARGKKYGDPTTAYTLDAVDVLRFEFADPYRWESREYNGQTVFASAIPTCYDGVNSFECGWLWRPRVLRATLQAGGTLTDATTYNFRVVYEYLDADQRYWYSSPSYPVELGEASNSVLTGGGNQSVELRIRMPSFTGMDKAAVNQSSRPRILVFMTGSAYGAEEFFLQQAFDYNPQLGDYLQVTIVAEPTDIGTQDRMYTFGGELENYGPPPCVSIESHRERLFAFSTYDFKLWYTKPSTYGRGTEWALEQSIPTEEDVVGLASLETTLVVFTTKGIYSLDGYGPSSTGVPPDAFSRLVLVTAEVALAETNAVARTPVGLIFKGQQGWWLLGRTLELRYLGAPVEDTFRNSLAYVTRSIDVDQARGCVRILCSNGLADFRYCYWYDSDRWSSDTLPIGRTWRDAISIGDQYYMIDTDACVKRSSVSYEDGQHGTDRLYQMQVQTGWVRFDNAAQTKRVWRDLISCKKLASSGLFVNISRDFDLSNVIIATTFTDDDLEVGPHLLRFHNPVQKVQALKIQVYDQQGDNVPGPFSSQTAGFELYAFGFELGLKRGGAKAPASKSR